MYVTQQHSLSAVNSDKQAPSLSNVSVLTNSPPSQARPRRRTQCNPPVHFFTETSLRLPSPLVSLRGTALALTLTARLRRRLLPFLLRELLGSAECNRQRTCFSNTSWQGRGFGPQLLPRDDGVARHCEGDCRCP